MGLPCAHLRRAGFSAGGPARRRAGDDRAASRGVAAGLSRGGDAEVIDLELDGVRVTLLPTAFSRAERAPSPREAAMFLDLAEQYEAFFRSIR